MNKFLMFLLGGTAGAVTALLTAPSSGKETRRRLRSTLNEAGDKASELSGRVAESFSRGTEALKDGFSKTFDNTGTSRAGQTYSSPK